MKRFFILASAAIVALASCAKTEVVYKDAPQEIAFKQITNVMTKGALGDNADVKLGVYSDYMAVGSAVTTPYFANVPFDGTTEWKGTPSQYYPLSGTLDFVGYAPYAETGAAAYSDNKLVLTLADNQTNQFDLLYSEKLTGIDKTLGATSQPILLYHALAKVGYKFTLAAGVTVTKVTLADTHQEGVYTVDYAHFGEKTGRWNTTDKAKASWVLENVTEATEDTYLVVPSDQTTITLEYTLGEGSAALSHKHTLTGKWEEGYQYTYEISITPVEIKLTPSAKAWDPATTTPITL